MPDRKQVLPVRMYQTEDRVMVAVPMPGLEPEDISVVIEGDDVRIEGKERGPHQHDREMLIVEWTIGPYYRELALPGPVKATLSNATYDNGVLVLSMPKAEPGQPVGRTEIRLESIAATRGEYVRHVGRQIVPTTTRQHRIDKHKTPHKPADGDPRDASPPVK
jgi:HSP20 family protein